MLSVNDKMISTIRVSVNLNETKQRYFLPGSLIHYIIFSYILDFSERHKNIESVRSNGMDYDDVRMVDSILFVGVVHILYDWKYFN